VLIVIVHGLPSTAVFGALEEVSLAMSGFAKKPVRFQFKSTYSKINHFGPMNGHFIRNPSFAVVLLNGGSVPTRAVCDQLFKWQVWGTALAALSDDN
jgi:hypothetical protein